MKKKACFEVCRFVGKNSRGFCEASNNLDKETVVFGNYETVCNTKPIERKQSFLTFYRLKERRNDYLIEIMTRIPKNKQTETKETNMDKQTAIWRVKNPAMKNQKQIFRIISKPISLASAV